MNEPEELRARLKTLEEIVLWCEKIEAAQLSKDQERSAGFEALFDLVEEIAAHEGISQEEFQRHYEMRFRYWHERNLHRIEDISPSRAAQMDTRSTNDLDIADPIPPLFGPPSPGAS